MPVDALDATPCDPGVTRLVFKAHGISNASLPQLIDCAWLVNGGEGQNRTVDTTIFSRMLYQLSYLATAED